MCLVLTRERMRMTPRVTLILKQASSSLIGKIATTWRQELRERVHRRTTADNEFHAAVTKKLPVELRKCKVQKNMKKYEFIKDFGF